MEHSKELAAAWTRHACRLSRFDYPMAVICDLDTCIWEDQIHVKILSPLPCYQMGKFYAQHSVKGQDAIHVIEIQPAKYDDPVQVGSDVLRLTTLSFYEVLSYT